MVEMVQKLEQTGGSQEIKTISTDLPSDANDPGRLNCIDAKVPDPVLPENSTKNTSPD